MTTQPQTGDDILTRISAMVREVSAKPPEKVTHEMRLLEDLGFDSVAQMELLSMLDESLGLEIEMEDAMDLQTIGDVVAVVERYVAAASA